MELYQELLPLEAELAYLGPGEGVDLGAVLEDENTKVGDCKVQGDSLVVLQQSFSLSRQCKQDEGFEI